MLDLKFIATNPDVVKASLQKRRKDALFPVFDEILRLDGERKSAIQEVEGLKSRRNQASQEIARLKKEKKDDKAILEEMKGVSSKVKQLDDRLSQIQDLLALLLQELPNVLQPAIPEGA